MKLKIFILIDQSYSMNVIEDEQACDRRWNTLARTIDNHVQAIFEQFNSEKPIICLAIEIYFFNNYIQSANSSRIYPNSSIYEILRNKISINQPKGSSYLVTQIDPILEDWIDMNNDETNQLCCIIIYTDGQLADPIELANLIADTCRKINNQNKLKIVMIGIGIDERSEIKPEFYQRIANNDYDFRDKNNESCQIFSFYLIDDMPENITDIFTGHFNGNTERGISDG